MKVNLKIIEQLVGFELPPINQLVEIVNSKLGGVEEIIDLDKKYQQATIVKVVECVKHPNADKLSVCKIDVGKGELVQVVCGAPNVHADMWAVWLPPESVVPNTYGTGEPFKLGSRELRGIVSNGMLASAKELDIVDDHQGIVELTDYDLPEDTAINAGDSFAKIFGLDSKIIDIENKMFTHRPDLFGQVGVAREIYAILQDLPSSEVLVENSFASPGWLLRQAKFIDADMLKLEVFNDAPQKSPRFIAVAMNNISVQASPMWLKCQLVAMGAKPINNVVDLTNLIMLMTSQPTHAYDYDKLVGHKLGVRMANRGEKIELLNDKIYQLDAQDIVIVDGDGPVGLAGVMGGKSSQVSEETKNIVLEVANFDMYTIRKTSMRHGLFTDAVTRFSKGQSALQTDRIIQRLIDLVPGDQASDVFDLPKDFAGEPTVYTQNAILVGVDFINDRLGTNFGAIQIGNILNFVEFTVQVIDGNNELEVRVPYWRTDIELPEDIVEEVGRLYGFDNIISTLPVRGTKPPKYNKLLRVKQQLRNNLALAGANELLTYSFVHKNILINSNQTINNAYTLSNALSPDLHCYRLSITPSLLDKVHHNIKAGYDEFALFELGKSHNNLNIGLDNLPEESNNLGLVYTNKNSIKKAAYYRAKFLLEFALKNLVKIEDIAYTPIDGLDLSNKPDIQELIAPFNNNRASLILINQKIVGVVGEYTKNTKKAFKLPVNSAGFELSVSEIIKLETNQLTYQPLSRYPKITQDISLKVASDVSYASLYDLVVESLVSQANDLSIDVSPISIYQAESEDLFKTITFHIVFVSPSRTLSDADIAPRMDYVAERAKNKLDASQV